MIRLAARIVSTLVQLVCQPIPAHAKTARPTTLVGEAPSGTAVPGERGEATSTPAHSRSLGIPIVELVADWSPHPAVRGEFTDQALAYRVAVWTQEVGL